MKLDFRKFKISFADGSAEPKEVDKDSILIGRLDSCEIHLDHSTVSRIHAGINCVDDNFTLVNLSTSTVNGRFAAYASVIDNKTNDPRTLLPK